MTSASIFHAVRDGCGRMTAPALVTHGRAWTVLELLDAAEVVAARLGRWPRPEEALVANLSDPAAVAVAMLACDMAGVPLVHRDPAAPGAPAGPTLQDSVRATGEVLCEAPLIRVQMHERSGLLSAGLPGGAQIFLTSGSTGHPVGVVRTAEAILADARRVAAFLGYGPDMAVVAAAPLFHAYGFNYGLVAPLLFGARAVHCSARSVPTQLARATHDHQAGTLIALPFHYALFTQISGVIRNRVTSGVASLMSAVSAGAPLGPGVAAGIAEGFRFALYNCYGSSEAGAVTLTPVTGAEENGHVGVPLPGIQASVSPSESSTDIGELRLRSDSLAAGRIGPQGVVPLEHDDEGWFRTGDLARTRPVSEGIRLVGRVRSLINVAGKKVSPVEIEWVLAEHPAVEEVHVFATADRANGQVPVAMVVLRETTAVHELVHWCRDRLAPAQVPRQIDLVDELPRSATGKVTSADVHPGVD